MLEKQIAEIVQKSILEVTGCKDLKSSNESGVLYLSKELTDAIQTLIAQREAAMVEALREARTLILDAKYSEAIRWGATYDKAREFADRHADIAKIDAVLPKGEKR